MSTEVQTAEASAPSLPAEEQELKPNQKELDSFVRTVIRALMDEPDKAKITVSFAAETEAFIVVQASRKECSRIVGKDGGTQQALKKLFFAVARKNKLYVSLHVRNIEDEDDENKPILAPRARERVQPRYDARHQPDHQRGKPPRSFNGNGGHHR